MENIIKRIATVIIVVLIFALSYALGGNLVFADGVLNDNTVNIEVNYFFQDDNGEYIIQPQLADYIHNVEDKDKISYFPYFFNSYTFDKKLSDNIIFEVKDSLKTINLYYNKLSEDNVSINHIFYDKTNLQFRIIENYDSQIEDTQNKRIYRYNLENDKYKNEMSLTKFKYEKILTNIETPNKNNYFESIDQANGNAVIKIFDNITGYDYLNKLAILHGRKNINITEKYYYIDSNNSFIELKEPTYKTIAFKDEIILKSSNLKINDYNLKHWVLKNDLEDNSADEIGTLPELDINQSKILNTKFSGSNTFNIINIYERVNKNIAQKNSEGFQLPIIQEEVQEEIQEEIQEEVQEEVPEEIQEEIQKEVQEEVPEEIQDVVVTEKLKISEDNLNTDKENAINLPLGVYPQANNKEKNNDIKTSEVTEVYKIPEKIQIGGIVKPIKTPLAISPNPSYTPYIESIPTSNPVESVPSINTTTIENKSIINNRLKENNSLIIKNKDNDNGVKLDDGIKLGHDQIIENVENTANINKEDFKTNLDTIDEELLPLGAAPSRAKHNPKTAINSFLMPNIIILSVSVLVISFLFIKLFKK